MTTQDKHKIIVDSIGVPINLKRKIKKIKKALEPDEHALQTAMINLLAYKGFYPMRLNSGKIPVVSKGKTRLINLLPQGTPDILAIKGGKCLFVEVKKHGNKPTLFQEARMAELRDYGAICIVSHDLDELTEQLKKIKI